MKSKVKEIMNKEEGFTLVELLAVIVILGIILAIAVPSVGKVISNSENKAEEADIALVEDAARLYFTTDKKAINHTGEGSVTIEKLIEKGYLDIKENKEIKGGVLRLKDGSFKYENKAAIGNNPEN